ncbi:unnamed protein product [Caenorhabditis nigoni]
MASEKRDIGQDGAHYQYQPGGILLICTYPKENGICGHVNNIFDCQPLTTTQAQEEENRSQKIKYIKVYNPPKVQLLKFRLVSWNQSEHSDLSNQELDDQKLDTAVQNEEEVIQDCNPEAQGDQEPIREDQKEIENFESADGYEFNEGDKNPIHDRRADRIASQAIHPHKHQALPTSYSPNHPIENPENFHYIDSEEDEYPIFGRPVTPNDETATSATVEIDDPHPENQHNAAEDLEEPQAIYEDMDPQDNDDEPAYGDPRFNEIVDYFPSTKRRRI